MKEWVALEFALEREMQGNKRITKPSAFIIAKRKLAVKGGREVVLNQIKLKIKEISNENRKEQHQ